MDNLEVLKKAVQDFFVLLDIEEESDSGRVFKPISISCCRCILTTKLDECLYRMKEYSK